ncbi:MAG: energy-coupled thiamine transporter ThiT [Clostridia bacterium]|nr:energy-coupled thiamine transporter ThiT [Clostridia bacterium]
MFSFLPAALAEEAAQVAEEVTEAVEETAAKADPTWSQELISKFGETPMGNWVALGTLVALGIILLAVTRSSKKWSAKMIAFGSLAISLSFVLSCIRLFRMPIGGSVTPGSMLPLMLFSVSFGVGPGLMAGLVYGVLQYMQGGWWLNVWQFILDYLLAFAAIGLAGIAHNKKDSWLYLAIPTAALGRAVCAILAGMMWVADTPVEDLVIGATHFNSPLLYSIAYNGTYLVPDTVICLILAFLTAKPLLKIMKTM